jgi:hypothetical protein
MQFDIQIPMYSFQNVTSTTTLTPLNPQRSPTQPREVLQLSEPTDTDHFTFGAGRRICPGTHLAENSLFILTGTYLSARLIVARLLWGFDISPPIDPNTGKKEVVDTWAYEPGASMIPKRFKAVFTARSPEREQIIRREWKEAEMTLKK